VNGVHLTSFSLKISISGRVSNTFSDRPERGLASSNVKERGLDNSNVKDGQERINRVDRQ